MIVIRSKLSLFLLFAVLSATILPAQGIFAAASIVYLPKDPIPPILAVDCHNRCFEGLLVTKIVERDAQRQVAERGSAPGLGRRPVPKTGSPGLNLRI